MGEKQIPLYFMGTCHPRHQNKRGTIKMKLAFSGQLLAHAETRRHTFDYGAGAKGHTGKGLWGVVWSTHFASWGGGIDLLPGSKRL